MVEDHFETLVSFDIVTTPQSPVLIHIVESEGNLSNITKTILVHISIKLVVIENINLGHNFVGTKFQTRFSS